MTATTPALAEAAAGPKARSAAPARPDAPKARRVLVAAADVRLFGLKLPGSLARVGGNVATTVASLGERIWDQLP